jgi:DNA ligase (NAD+)
LKPVRLGGVVIRRATLHNISEIEKKDLCIGDSVIIQRAGDVIPEVVSAVKEKRPGDAKRYRVPEKCPVCGSEVVIFEGESLPRCINASCTAQIKERVRHFSSKEGMNIEGLGEKISDYLVESRLISSLPDIYRLDMQKLLTIPGFKDKAADNLFRAIQKSKAVPMEKFLFALGIRFVGSKAAKILAERFSSLKGIMACTEEEIQETEGIGAVTARSISGFFSDSANRGIIEDFFKLGITFSSRKRTKASGTFFSGRKVVITGELSAMPRSRLRERIESMGGEVSESVSSKTDFLITGGDPGSKLAKARELGTRIIEEEELLRILDKEEKNRTAPRENKNLPQQELF